MREEDVKGNTTEGDFYERQDVVRAVVKMRKNLSRGVKGLSLLLFAILGEL